MGGIIGPCGAYRTIQDEGVDLTQRRTLDFAGAGVTATDDAANERTLVTIPGAAASALTLIYGPAPLGAAADFDFTSIPATYVHLKLVGSLRGANAATSAGVGIRLNGVAGTSYHYTYIVNTAAAVSPSQSGASGQPAGYLGGVTGSTASSAVFGSFEATIFNYTSLTNKFEIQGRTALFASTALASMIQYSATTLYATTGTAISRVEIFNNSVGGWDVNSRLALYGLTG